MKDKRCIDKNDSRVSVAEKKSKQKRLMEVREEERWKGNARDRRWNNGRGRAIGPGRRRMIPCCVLEEQNDRINRHARQKCMEELMNEQNW